MEKPQAEGRKVKADALQGYYTAPCIPDPPQRSILRTLLLYPGPSHHHLAKLSERKVHKAPRSTATLTKPPGLQTQLSEQC